MNIRRSCPLGSCRIKPGRNADATSIFTTPKIGQRDRPIASPLSSHDAPGGLPRPELSGLQRSQNLRNQTSQPNPPTHPLPPENLKAETLKPGVECRDPGSMLTAHSTLHPKFHTPHPITHPTPWNTLHPRTAAHSQVLGWCRVWGVGAEEGVQVQVVEDGGGDFVLPPQPVLGCVVCGV